ncbi:TetR/AcrR family transcriptional regulator [Marinomonas sp. C2222]|uniref:TetR/AcrR family transcriptional regulator n=1 Tax=Marinomonas sargassi TaxID=2984494 RepID=A0ABT2YUP6_9GAMM|nr:TetR/AcrR family transcriptional regulator [Marinomonas sargassi]MCV2403615.1 TetR/AcrR family transcriptional regulator [Marinomonas sargassi]
MTKNDVVKKKVGRPISFDRNKVLIAAMRVFWAKGYDGASMKDLTKAMGINGPSLYAEFGDKRELYLAAIECYGSHNGCAPLNAFEGESDIKLAVRAFLVAVIEYSTENGRGALGCFLGSCVATSAGEVEGVRELLYEAIQDTDKRLSERFEFEKSKGCLPADFPSVERAKLMLDLRQGYVFRARSGVSPTELLSDIAFRTKLILGTCA